MRVSSRSPYEGFLSRAAICRPFALSGKRYGQGMMNNIVDVMPHPGTSPETMAIVRDFAVRPGQISVPLKWTV